MFSHLIMGCWCLTPTLKHNPCDTAVVLSTLDLHTMSSCLCSAQLAVDAVIHLLFMGCWSRTVQHAKCKQDPCDTAVVQFSWISRPCHPVCVLPYWLWMPWPIFSSWAAGLKQSNTQSTSMTHVIRLLYNPPGSPDHVILFVFCLTGCGRHARLLFMGFWSHTVQHAKSKQDPCDKAVVQSSWLARPFHPLCLCSAWLAVDAVACLHFTGCLSHVLDIRDAQWPMWYNCCAIHRLWCLCNVHRWCFSMKCFLNETDFA